MAAAWRGDLLMVGRVAGRLARTGDRRRELTPTLDPAVLHRLSQGGTALSASVAVVILIVLNAALVAKILLRSPHASSRGDAVRVLDAVVIPLLVLFVVFIPIMVERLGVLP